MANLSKIKTRISAVSSALQISRSVRAVCSMRLYTIEKKLQLFQVKHMAVCRHIIQQRCKHRTHSIMYIMKTQIQFVELRIVQMRKYVLHIIIIILLAE